MKSSISDLTIPNARVALPCFALLTALTLVACGGSEKSEAIVAPPPPTVSSPPYKIVASVQEIMRGIVDPAADRVWDSVGSTVTQKGAEDRQPRTAEEWEEVRGGAITVLEATNLLVMPGRQMVPAGGKMLDEGSEGVLTAAEAQQKLAAQSATFAQFAVSLREVAEKTLKVVDAKDAQGLFAVGEEMDAVCEACHMTFWYPGQPVYRPKKGGK